MSIESDRWAASICRLTYETIIFLARPRTSGDIIEMTENAFVSERGGQPIFDRCYLDGDRKY
jgi:hypothetical protein